MRTEFTKLLKLLRKTFPGADLELLRQAYRTANRAHAGQVRLSGEPYVTHSIAVAKILAQLGLDLTTVAAGLIHDVLEDTPMTRESLADEFGEEMATLVDGVTKIHILSLPAKAATLETTQEEKQAQNLLKMLIATAQDVRVILIKLADRLHNMRTLEYLPPDRARRVARETLDIYAPLAHRLGIAQWKWELEDHAFHHLNPEEYRRMAERVAMKRREREAWLRETIALLEVRLAEAGVKARVIGRPKHLYSIYRKMAEQGIDFDQVMDVLAVRIITETVPDCYNALGVVHQLWSPIPGRIKDYIAMPKINMYQSVHTTVMRENGLPLEVQIRTEDMDRTAREGIAAHWIYKEGGRKPDPKFETQLQWFRQLYEWLKDAHAPGELLDTLRRDMGTSDVYVFTPKGEVKELPKGATPLDFAYLIHSDIGDQCIGARVNGRMTPLRYNLQTGDVVEIITSRMQCPHRDWLDLVVTARARYRIRQRLRERAGLEPAAADTKREEPSEPAEPKPRVRPVDDATRYKLIRIQGMKGLHVQFAKCCGPMPGHAVIGYATKNPGITIHRADCRNFMSTKRDLTRIVRASWEGDEHYEAGMRVTLGQRPNALADITNAIRPMNISIMRAEYHPEQDGKGFFDFVFEAPDRETIDRVAATMRTVPGVTAISKLPPSQLARLR